MAYDAVSARLVIADEASDTLKIFSEVSGTATDLVSRGWADPYRTTAIAIDGRRGDLWVAGVDASGGSPRASFSACNSFPDGCATACPCRGCRGGAVRSRGPVGGECVRARCRRPPNLRGRARRQDSATADGHSCRRAGSLAVARDNLAFVSHAGGLLRLDLDARRSAALTVAKRVDVRGLQSMGPTPGRCSAFSGEPTAHSRRSAFDFDSAARRATSLEVLGPAASRAATVMNGVLSISGEPAGRPGDALDLRPLNRCSRDGWKPERFRLEPYTNAEQHTDAEDETERGKGGDEALHPRGDNPADEAVADGGRHDGHGRGGRGGKEQETVTALVRPATAATKSTPTAADPPAPCTNPIENAATGDRPSDSACVWPWRAGCGPAADPRGRAGGRAPPGPCGCRCE